MKKFILALISLLTIFFNIARADINTEKKDFCLVFVHIGPEFPAHLPIALRQARLFNPSCPIFLIGNRKAFSRFDSIPSGVTPVMIDSLKQSSYHHSYLKNTKDSGFWRYTLERFFFLDDFIQQYNLKNVFHLENDVMIYFDLEKKLEVFETCYENMLATTFDCDERAVPGFVYLSNPKCSSLFASFLAARAHLGEIDATLLYLFKTAYYKTFGDHLPILIPSYAQQRPLTSLSKKTAKSADPFCSHLDQLQLIFDAAALGQFFGGIDPVLGNTKPGFIAELSVFNPMFFDFEWIKDSENRWVPYIAFKEEKYPIANLHIHNKNLQLFYSENEDHFPLPTSFWSSLPIDDVK